MKVNEPSDIVCYVLLSTTITASAVCFRSTLIMTVTARLLVKLKLICRLINHTTHMHM